MTKSTGVSVTLVALVIASIAILASNTLAQAQSRSNCFSEPKSEQVSIYQNVTIINKCDVDINIHYTITDSAGNVSDGLWYIPRCQTKTTQFSGSSTVEFTAVDFGSGHVEGRICLGQSKDRGTANENDERPASPTSSDSQRRLGKPESAEAINRQGQLLHNDIAFNIRAKFSSEAEIGFGSRTQSKSATQSGAFIAHSINLGDTVVTLAESDGGPYKCGLNRPIRNPSGVTCSFSRDGNTWSVKWEKQESESYKYNWGTDQSNFFAQFHLVFSLQNGNCQVLNAGGTLLISNDSRVWNGYYQEYQRGAHNSVKRQDSFLSGSCSLQ